MRERAETGESIKSTRGRGKSFLKARKEESCVREQKVYPNSLDDTLRVKKMREEEGEKTTNENSKQL